jgi:aspartate-semialdehyde dehydrogenase
MNKIGIVGVNGLVGKAILDSIKLLNLQKHSYVFYGSSDGEIFFNGIQKVHQFHLTALDDLDYAILAVDNNIAKEVYEYVHTNNLKVNVIDNSSEFRLYKNVPLCIPEINSYTLKGNRFISNPNCVTTIMCMILKPLLELSQINRIVCSTYQAASGAGYKGLEELQLQTKQISDTNSVNFLTKDFWKKQYVYNVFSHNSKMTPNGYNEEEMKLVNETNKILNLNCNIVPTCIRVPTLRSHCVSMNVEFDDELNKEDILDVLNEFPGVKVLDNPDQNEFPEPILTSGKTDIYVGRIRPDLNNKKCWNFFISGDQLLKGAGYNSVQILKQLME